MSIISHTDPISFNPGSDQYIHRESQGDSSLEVRFESDANRQAYLDIPLEASSLDFSNDVDEGYDEG